MRHEHATLRHGSIDAPAFIDAHVVVLFRRDGERWAITAMNNDNAPHTIKLDLPESLTNAAFVDALSGTRSKAAGNALMLTVPPMFGSVLENRR
jgi:hypothetical protein